ncbi:MAG: hypothetical protein WD906_00080 [Anaerolineales bacterium]
MAENTILEATRRNIKDYLTLSANHWAGRLPEPDFLARLYDLSKLPSFDSRLSTASGDIYQHRISFHDWEDDWVFTDSRFALLWTSDSDFLRFLCETLHPIVRPNPDESRALAAEYNKHLLGDGWELYEAAELSGRPVFGARKLGQRAIIFAEPTGWEKVDRQIQELRLRLHEATTEEQFQEIGFLSREVMISTAEAVYRPERHPSLDGVTPSPTDAKRMLEAFFAIDLQGAANEEARAHARAALGLANALQHKRTADYRMGALCAEATAAVVNLAAIVSGRRP